MGSLLHSIQMSTQECLEGPVMTSNVLSNLQALLYCNIILPLLTYRLCGEKSSKAFRIMLENANFFPPRFLLCKDRTFKILLGIFQKSNRDIKTYCAGASCVWERHQLQAALVGYSKLWKLQLFDKRLLKL